MSLRVLGSVLFAAAAVSARTLLVRGGDDAPVDKSHAEAIYTTPTKPSPNATSSDDVLVVNELAPGYAGFNLKWLEPFGGNAGQMVNEANWEIITNINVNNEWQKYTRSTQNMQISGGGTLQIVPVLDHATGQWTSGRVESWYTFTPTDGKVTLAEGKIRFGDAPYGNKQGIWPAFWILGDSIRRGVNWPACGEIDIMERVNGPTTGYGTIHCDVYPGGACREPQGRGASVEFYDNGWHTWRVQWDRTPGNWADESLTWFVDGRQFHRVAAWELGQGVWESLAARPLHFILNVAVGGNWPGPPNDQTWDWWGNMMEVAYVAHYESQ
ncbi:hypothetical protein DL770_006301 [Monosporascus sp. CRB-9-2]|nr:hypothetical protein DL770_006301 [Monosporascus sp. CRB-9-2]